MSVVSVIESQNPHGLGKAKRRRRRRRRTLFGIKGLKMMMVMEVMLVVAKSVIVEKAGIRKLLSQTLLFNNSLAGPRRRRRLGLLN